MRSKAGEIFSPNFKNRNMYPQGVNCTWHIIAPHDHRLFLNFLTIDLLPSRKCNDDYVQLSEINRINKTGTKLIHVL